MNGMFHNSRATINRVKVHGGHESPIVTRLRTTSLLNGVDWRPPGVPPSAILMIDHLGDPLPGQLHRTPVPVRPSPVWERALATSLGERYRQAQLPHQGVLPAHAEALVFQDRAELLACMIVDLHTDSKHQQWWQMLGKDYANLRRPIEVLRVEPIWIPAILDYLDRWHQAEDVLSMLSPHEATEIWHAVTAAHQLTSLSPDAVTRIRNENESGEALSPLEAGDGLINATIDGQNRLHINRMRSLTAEQQVLLHIAWVIHRQPARARTAEFADRLHAWWQMAALAGQESSVQPNSAGSQSILDRGYAASDRAGFEGISDTHENPVSHIHASQASTSNVEGQDGMVNAPTLPGTASLPTSSDDSSDHTVDQTVGDKISPSNGFTETQEARNASRTPGQGEKANPAQPVTMRETGQLPAGIVTSWAGIFYLINLMHWLDLPGCFEERWGLETECGAWGTLALLAKGLIDDQGYADSLWALLTDLVGSDLQDLDEKLRIPDRLIRPRAWIDLLAPENLSPVFWSNTRQRIQVWSADDLLLADIPRETAVAPQAQVRNLLKDDLDIRQRPMKASGQPMPSLVGRGLTSTQVWLQWVTPFVLTFLRRILALDISEQLVDLLQVPGIVHVSATHVDIVIPLDHIALPVRRCGLDRNPGWVAELGRIILFHFE